MHFKALELEDIPAVKPYFDLLGSDICDYTVGGMFMWRDFYGVEYTVEDGIFYSLVHNEQHSKILYDLPIGKTREDIVRGIRNIMEYEKDDPAQLRFVTIEERFLPLFKEAGMVFRAHNNEIYSDYVYSTEEFLKLSGKKNHKKKNHIQQFIRSCGEWSFEEIGHDNLEEAKEFFRTQYSVDEEANEEEVEENDRAMEVLDKFDEYGMFGGVLRADGKICGFSIGEIFGRTLFVHIEKASREHPGAYQMLNHQFAEHFGQGIERINREEDMGDEGLRRSKSSYHPIELVKKYVVEAIRV
jgi:hypothetical protein